MSWWSSVEILFIAFGRDISLILQTREISLFKNNSCDLHWVITHSHILVIILQWKPFDLCGFGHVYCIFPEYCNQFTFIKSPIVNINHLDLWKTHSKHILVMTRYIWQQESYWQRKHLPDFTTCLAMYLRWNNLNYLYCVCLYIIFSGEK